MRDRLDVSAAPSKKPRPDGGSRQRPLPLDDAYEATPAFYAMRGAFDVARQPVVPTDITRPGGVAPAGEQPFAPFAVPGSPQAAPKR